MFRDHDWTIIPVVINQSTSLSVFGVTCLYNKNQLLFWVYSGIWEEVKSGLRLDLHQPRAVLATATLFNNFFSDLWGKTGPGCRLLGSPEVEGLDHKLISRVTGCELAESLPFSLYFSRWSLDAHPSSTLLDDKRCYETPHGVSYS